MLNQRRLGLASNIAKRCLGNLTTPDRWATVQCRRWGVHAATAEFPFPSRAEAGGGLSSSTRANPSQGGDAKPWAPRGSPGYRKGERISQVTTGPRLSLHMHGSRSVISPFRNERIHPQAEHHVQFSPRPGSHSPKVTPAQRTMTTLRVCAFAAPRPEA